MKLKFTLLVVLGLGFSFISCQTNENSKSKIATKKDSIYMNQKETE